MTNHSDVIANPTASATVASPASEGAPALRVRVQKRYRGDAGFALDVDFAAPAGFTILFGASGAGKTTLLECVAGLATPGAGMITVGSRTFFDSEARIDLAVADRKVGYVFQDLALFPHLSVEGNVAYGLSRLSAADRERQIASVLEAFRIHDLRKKRPREISGGEGFPQIF